MSTPFPLVSGVRPGIELEERPGAADGIRSRNRQARTDAIASAALHAFLKDGLESVTIEAIVRLAGTAKGSFYRYFVDKQQLVECLVEPVREAFLRHTERCRDDLAAAEATADVYAAYQNLALNLAAIFVEHRAVVTLYLQEARGPAVGARMALHDLACEIDARAIELTNAAIDHGLIKPLDARVSGLSVVGAAEALLYRATTGMDLGPPHVVAAALIQLVLDGVRVR